MLEMSMAGKKEILLEHGGVRKFLKDGDEIIMTAVCQVIMNGHTLFRILPKDFLSCRAKPNFIMLKNSC